MKAHCFHFLIKKTDGWSERQRWLFEISVASTKLGQPKLRRGNTDGRQFAISQSVRKLVRAQWDETQTSKNLMRRCTDVSSKKAADQS
jgi:hypothetical protein